MVSVKTKKADVMELADMQDLESCGEIRAGSTPVIGNKKLEKGLVCRYLYLPWKNAQKYQSFCNVKILDISDCGKFLKLQGKIFQGDIHTDWFGVSDIIRVNYENEKVLDKFKEIKEKDEKHVK